MDLRPDPTWPRPVLTGRMLFPIAALTVGVFFARLLPESVNVLVQLVLGCLILVWTGAVAAVVYARAFRQLFGTRSRHRA